MGDGVFCRFHRERQEFLYRIDPSVIAACFRETSNLLAEVYLAFMYNRQNMGKGT